MAAAPKLTPEQWQQVRARWETDERAGFQWVVDDMGLPVSEAAVRKRAKAEKWEKRPIKLTARAARKAKEAALKPVRGPAPKSAKPSEDDEPSADSDRTIEPVDPSKVLDEFGSLDLPPKQELFVREVCTDFNPTKAAIRAGYSEHSASQIGCNLMSNPKVQAAIAIHMRARVQRMGREADELVKFHLAVIEFDPNEVAEHRVHACRHCWGVDFAPQHTPSSWAREREAFNKRRDKLSETAQMALGEFPAVPPDGWYEAKRGPNDDCPECHGVGIAIVKWKDSRHFSPAARLLLQGIKEGKDGREMVMLQKQASLNTLSSHLGLNKVAEQQVSVAIVTETAQKYETIMAQARERQRAVLIERGVIDAGG